MSGSDYLLDPPDRWKLPSAHRVTSSALVFWTGFAFLVAIEYLLFRQFVVREVLTAVPIAHDQTSFLSHAYETFDWVLDDGLLRGIVRTIWRASARSMLLNVAALPLFMAFGASRLTALTLNFIVFAAAQAVVAVSAKRLTGRRSMSCLALGLLLASGSFRLLVGGMYDFRLESIATSLYAACVGIVLASDGFRSRAWAVGATSSTNGRRRMPQRGDSSRDSRPASTTSSTTRDRCSARTSARPCSRSLRRHSSS